MVNQAYPIELQLNNANSSDTEAPFPFLDLLSTSSDGFISSKIYDNAMMSILILQIFQS